MIAETLKPEAVLAHGMARHHLLPETSPPTLEQVGAGLGGIHAQVMSCAELGAWVRTGQGVEAVRAALWRDRSLVKTWFRRGTLHLVPAAELGLFSAGLAGRADSSSRHQLWLRYVGITEQEHEALTEAVVRLLDGRAMTRKELAVELDEPRLASGWGGLLHLATSRGLICFGPSRGQETTFVRVDQWVGPLQSWDPAAARREMLRRYLRLDGPATVSDFAWWAGAEPRWARAAWADLEAELVEVGVGGRHGWMLGGDIEIAQRAQPRSSVRLLPGFDAYVLGHRSRDHILHPAFKSLVSRTAGWISPVLLVQGRVAGVWSHQRRPGAVEVEVRPFERLAGPLRMEVRQEALALAAFFEAPCRLAIV